MKKDSNIIYGSVIFGGSVVQNKTVSVLCRC